MAEQPRAEAGGRLEPRRRFGGGSEGATDLGPGEVLAASVAKRRLEKGLELSRLVELGRADRSAGGGDRGGCDLLGREGRRRERRWGEDGHGEVEWEE